MAPNIEYSKFLNVLWKKKKKNEREIRLNYFAFEWSISMKPRWNLLISADHSATSYQILL